MDDVVNLSGKVAIVTGSSRGLGRGMAKALAHAGADVVITSRTMDSLAEVSEEITALGAKVLALELDVRDEASIRSMPEKVLDRFERIDVLVNNAGMNIRKPALEVTWEDWDQILDTNLKSGFFCAQAVAPQMIKQKWGRIINITSVAGVMGNAGQANYAAAKAGIIGFTRAVAREVASRQVTVNAVAPGFVLTDMTADLSDDQKKSILDMIPLGRHAEPEDIAPLVAFLASDAACYITGQTLHVDGGLVMQ